MDLVNSLQHSDSDDQFASALPGDSFPETGKLLLGSSIGADDPMLDSEDEDEPDASEEETLLRRLNQSQARMEQIKRMLVNQRGFIVQALRQMAETRSNGCCEESRTHSTSSSEQELEQRDRTLGKTLRYAPERLDTSTSSDTESAKKQKMCPMCEAAFPEDVDQEEFELHVVEHFCYEEPDTIKYVGPGSSE
jgi:hypothetical protein